MNSGGEKSGSGQKRAIVRKPAEDRRVERSRDALHRAALALVQEKGFDAVTIEDIVERANVGRSTLYAHFDGKEGLLTSGLVELRAMLTRHQQAALASGGDLGQRCLGFSAALFEHAADYRPVYRAMAGERGSVIVMNRMRGLLADLVRDDLAALAAPTEGDPLPRSALVQFVVGALVSMLLWWTERDPPLPAAEVDAMFRRLVLPGIAAALRPNALLED
jgi:AcrR family transcriptional regulator